MVRGKMNVGILGGGQLALMLAEAALKKGLHPWALVGADGEPVTRLCPKVRRWNPADPRPVREFLEAVDIVAFENEFFPSFLMEQAGDLARKFVPSVPVIETVRNKLTQKQWLAKLGLPTAPFVAREAGDDLEAWVRASLTRFPSGAVFKWGLGGYDGKGVCVAPPGADGAFAKALAFCVEADRRQVPLFVEALVPFVRELAIIGVRNGPHSGDFRAYPLIVSEQERGICKLVTGPAIALGVPTALEAEAAHCAESFSRETGIRGAFGMEFFETADGRLQVNEVAPRVHNSGHYTQDACRVSQFENHWRAVLGESLGDTHSRFPAFAMLNLLGPSDGASLAPPLVHEGVFFHDYFKTECRVGRKMAHLNGVTEGVGDLPALLKRLRVAEAEWAAGPSSSL
jgi:5-(carboxyamino)imidazole ribonucleotide synthase